jgi:hypothetical protein
MHGLCTSCDIGLWFGTCLVDSCVGDVGHLVEMFHWCMIHARVFD